MNGNAKILFFCMIFVGKGAFGQYNAEKLLIIKDLYKVKPAGSKSGQARFNIFTVKKDTIGPVAATINKPSPVISPVAYSLISPNYYTQHFGFFCKKELQAEKITKIPIKFRLGSVQQCDWMEGKPNAVK